MKVETYEVISVDEHNGDVVNELVSEEALALIEALDLGGQRGLLAERKVSGETVTTRNPYRRMTQEEMNIFTTLMPNRHVLARYDEGPLPLRVLQVAAHAKELYDELQVWAPEPGRDDPILVGVEGGSNYGHGARVGGKLFLLARWGEHLDELDTLRAKAKQSILARTKAEIAEARSGLASFEAGLEAKIDGYLHGGRDASEHVSVSLSR